MSESGLIVVTRIDPDQAGSHLQGTMFVGPQGRIPGGPFNMYLSACKAAGGRYSAEHKSQIVSEDKIAVLVLELKKAGFEVSIDEALRDVLRAAQSDQIEQNLERRERIDSIEAELATRDLHLYPFQRPGVAWLIDRDRALLADEMGLGKTVQALVALPKGAPVVVVAPAVGKGVWLTEARRWRPEFDLKICKGRQSFRWPREGEIVILNYDILPEVVQTNPEAKRPKLNEYNLANCDTSSHMRTGTVVIADEAHALKNPKAKRTLKFKVLAAKVLKHEGRCWLLTGTPMLNRPRPNFTGRSAAMRAANRFTAGPP